MDTVLKEGIQLYRENRYEEALAAFLKISSKDVELNFDLAYEQDKVDKSLSLYEKALELDPDNPTALNGLGYILADTEKDLTRALILCKKALDAQPDNPAYLDSLAWTYYKMGFDTEARSYIQRANEQLPDNIIIKRHLQRIMNG